MRKTQYEEMEAYMHRCMEDSAHDREHVYRVMHTAMLIASGEEPIDWDVLICASLLHDIGRAEQFADPSLCHATVGAEKAYRFLLEQGYCEAFAQKVRHCIAAHRFRTNCLPQTPEAKILYDADKLDAVGAMGIARTLLYQGHEGAPIYSLREDGTVSDGAGEETDSFFREYKFKLEKLYSQFYTKQGNRLAQERQQAATEYYKALLREAQESRQEGKSILERRITG